MENIAKGEKGASLVGYALVVVLIAVVGIAGLGYVGESTSAAFTAAGEGLGGTLEDPEPELTPEEKWAKAREDYKNALDEAKAKKNYDIAAAKANFNKAVAENKSLPKSERKAANKQARSKFNSSKSDANSQYKASVATTKADRAAAKKEYKASK